MADISEAELRQIYGSSKTIAVVGASSDPDKAAHRIPAYLHSYGYRMVGVSPTLTEFLGGPVFPSLGEVDVPVDVVEVFRPADEAPEIARQAVDIGAKVLWLQLGIVSEEADRIGREGGLTVVMDRCMGATHATLELGMAPAD